MATLVLTVGVLALEGTARAVERMVGSGGRMGAAAVAAASRLELLRAGGCAALSDSGSRGDRLELRWTVSPSGTLRAVAVSVSYPDGRGARTELVEAAWWCP